VTTSDPPTPRIEIVEDERASSQQLETFARARWRYGWVPNTIRVMARSGSAARNYLDAGERNTASGLSSLERELIAVATASFNRCGYCLAAHSVNLMAHGASREEAIDAQEGVSPTARSAAILTFARAILEQRGAVSAEEIAVAARAGLDDATLLDVAAVVAENVLGNYVNNLAATPIDSVVVRAIERLELPLGQEVVA
jgi:uncharacterized peroxidase-related enzyme